MELLKLKKLQDAYSPHERQGRRSHMYMAIAVDVNPKDKLNYRVWHLIIGRHGKVTGIGVKSKNELLKSAFENFRRYGETNWRCFKKGEEKSTPIEIADFVAMNSFENTHFGNLPTLAEFQKTLNELEANLELRSIA
jgi:hypothetical protein